MLDLILACVEMHQYGSSTLEQSLYFSLMDIRLNLFTDAGFFAESTDSCSSCDHQHHLLMPFAQSCHDTSYSRTVIFFVDRQKIPRMIGLPTVATTMKGQTRL